MPMRLFVRNARLTALSDHLRHGHPYMSHPNQYRTPNPYLRPLRLHEGVPQTSA
jgi:hypothetical protein